MKKKDFILALLVVIVWGANFTVIKLGLDGVPSMLLVVLRYIASTFPAIFFVKRPNIGLKHFIIYSLNVGVLQFACVFYALELGMPASLSSIILQLQAFISPTLAFIYLHEKLKVSQLVGIFIALAGLYVIGMASVSSGISAVPIGAILLTVCAPVFWSVSNIVARLASEKAAASGEKLDMFSLVVWAGIVQPVPLLMLALMFDTPETLINTVVNLSPVSIFSILYLGYGATLFGYGIWNNLIVKYPLNKISPLSLMVPITGLLTARIVLSEQLSKMQWLGVSVILAGLIITNIDIKSIAARLEKNTKKEA